MVKTFKFKESTSLLLLVVSVIAALAYGTNEGSYLNYSDLVERYIRVSIHYENDMVYPANDPSTTNY